MGLDEELGDEFDGDFDEFGRGFADSTFADEFGGDFDEFDELGGCVCCVFADFGGAFDEFGGCV